MSINVIPRHNTVKLCESGRVREDILPPSLYERCALFVNEALEWVDAILDKGSMPTSLQSCLISFKIATALQESLKTG